MENEVKSLKKELSIFKKALDSHPALKTAMEKLVAEAHKMDTNSTTHIKTNSTHTKTNSTHKDSDIVSNRHEATKLVLDLATQQQKRYGSDSDRHGDHEDHDNLSNQKLHKDQDVGIQAGESD